MVMLAGASICTPELILDVSYLSNSSRGGANPKGGGKPIILAHSPNDSV